MADDEQERILAAFRETTMFREATEPMRQALVQADSYLSLIGHRHAHTLPPDLRREVLDCSTLCRRLSEGGA
jgi:hypothetical protein